MWVYQNSKGSVSSYRVDMRWCSLGKHCGFGMKCTKNHTNEDKVVFCEEKLKYWVEQLEKYKEFSEVGFYSKEGPLCPFGEYCWFGMKCMKNHSNDDKIVFCSKKVDMWAMEMQTKEKLAAVEIQRQNESRFCSLGKYCGFGMKCTKNHSKEDKIVFCSEKLEFWTKKRIECEGLVADGSHKEEESLCPFGEYCWHGLKCTKPHSNKDKIRFYKGKEHIWEAKMQMVEKLIED